MTCELHLEAFSGPFDLLLHLIEVNQVDIYDIPISEITSQYLIYLQAMEELDLEIASSFLVMAANLLSIKSRMLVPTYREDGELEMEIVDEREQLVSDILEYMRFKEAASVLGTIADEEGKYFFRQNDVVLYASLFADNNPFKNKDIRDLTNAFSEIMKKMTEQQRVLNIVREEITIHQKLQDIFELVSENPRGVRFEQVFEHELSRLGLVVSFLALLELIHRSIVKFRQSKCFGEIYIYPYELSNFHGV